MRAAAHLLTLILALSIALLSGLESSRVHAKANTDEDKHANIPLGRHVTKHLRPYIETPQFYEEDPLNPMEKGQEGFTVQKPGKDDGPSGRILGKEASFKNFRLRISSCSICFAPCTNCL